MENSAQEDKLSALSAEKISKISLAAAEVPKKEVSKEEVPKEGGQDPNVTNEEHKAISKDDFNFPFPSCRFVFTVMGFLGFIMVYSLRVNMSVPLVAMANATYVRLHKDVVHKAQDSCTTNDTKPPPKFPGTFNLDTAQQSHILAAFFFGYLFLQVPGGVFAQKVGGKIILVGGLFITSVFTLLTPVIAEKGGYAGLIAVRVVEGLAEGVSYPSMHVLISKWSTPQERSKMVTFIYSGSKLGIVITSPVAGLLCATLGWESVFYITGGVGALWCLCSIFLIYDNPSEHPRINPEEYRYIEVFQGQRPAKGSLQVPWLEIAKSPPVYALVIAQFAYNWGNFSLLTCLPQYYKYVLDIDIKHNGVFSAIPYLLMWMLMMLTGVACDFLKSHDIMSVTNIRKFMISFSFVGAGAFIIGTGYVGCGKAVAVALVTLSVGWSGISWGGWSVNQLDLAPPYAGTLMGITNGISTIAGIVGPIAVGTFTKDEQSRATWRKFFFLTAALYLFGTIAFVAFGSGKRQKWGYEPSTDTTKTEPANRRESK